MICSTRIIENETKQSKTKQQQQQQQQDQKKTGLYLKNETNEFFFLFQWMVRITSVIFS